MADVAHRSPAMPQTGWFAFADRFRDKLPATLAVVGLVAGWQFIV